RQMRSGVVELARARLGAGLAARDVRSEFDREGWRHCAEFGILGLPIPKEYGGLGCDAITTVGVLERLGYGCRDNGLVFAINAHMWTAEMPLLHFGNEAQRRRWLPGLARGQLIGG